jgi:hypothetical protein
MPSSNSGEYTNSRVSSSGCSYANLHSYNQNYFGRNGGAVGAPVQSQTSSNEVIIVPAYGGVGYNSLNQGQSNSSGYYNIRSSYPNYPSACNQFSSQLCRR